MPRSPRSLDRRRPSRREYGSPPLSVGIEEGNADTTKGEATGTQDASLAECLDLLRIPSEHVETGKQVVHPVHEEAQVDAWAPGQGVPRHRSAVSGGYETSQHPEEGRPRNRCGPVHAHRASATQDDPFRSEGSAPNWRSEELFLRREPGKLFVGRNPQIRSGDSHLVDHRPIDAVLGTQRVGRAVPLRRAYLGY